MKTQDQYKKYCKTNGEPSLEDMNKAQKPKHFLTVLGNVEEKLLGKPRIRPYLTRFVINNIIKDACARMANSVNTRQVTKANKLIASIKQKLQP